MYIHAIHHVTLIYHVTNCPYEYVFLLMHVTVDYVMLYMYAEKLNKFKLLTIFYDENMITRIHT